MYLHAYPTSYPYTPFPGAYMEPVTPRPAPSTAMVNNQQPFATPGLMTPPQAPPPAITETRNTTMSDAVIQQSVDILSRASVDYSITPDAYNQAMSDLLYAAPDLFSAFPTPDDYASAYAQHHGVAPAAPAKTGGNVGILAALAAGAYFLFRRK
jgi:hypothetical protein